MRGNQVGKAKGRRVKSIGHNDSEGEVFWMSLEEAKQAIADKYEFLVDRYERQQKKQS